MGQSPRGAVDQSSPRQTQAFSGREAEFLKIGDLWRFLWRWRGLVAVLTLTGTSIGLGMRAMRSAVYTSQIALSTKQPAVAMSNPAEKRPAPKYNQSLARALNDEQSARAFAQALVTHVIEKGKDSEIQVLKDGVQAQSATEMIAGLTNYLIYTLGPIVKDDTDFCGGRFLCLHIDSSGQVVGTIATASAVALPTFSQALVKGYEALSVDFNEKTRKGSEAEARLREQQLRDAVMQVVSERSKLLARSSVLEARLAVLEAKRRGESRDEGRPLVHLEVDSRAVNEILDIVELRQLGHRLEDLRQTRQVDLSAAQGLATELEQLQVDSILLATKHRNLESLLTLLNNGNPELRLWPLPELISATSGASFSVVKSAEVDPRFRRQWFTLTALGAATGFVVAVMLALVLERSRARS